MKTPPFSYVHALLRRCPLFLYHVMEPVIRWGDARVEQAPADIVLIPGRPVSVFGKIVKGGKAGLDITVSGKDGRESFEWPIKFVEIEGEDSPIPTLWARERIRMLEEREAEIAGRGSRQREQKEKKAEETIIGLSKKYGILSRLTSYVAIEEREEKDKSTGEILLRKVPVLVTIGWHGRGSVFGVRNLLASMAPPMLMQMRESYDSFSLEYKMSSDTDLHLMKRHVDYSMETDENAVLREILACQEWSGGFVIDTDIADILGLDIGEITAKAAEIQNAGTVDPFLLLSTAILLQVLHLRFADYRDQWEGVTRKTKKWMDDIVKIDDPRLNDLPVMEWAENYVGEKPVQGRRKQG